MSSKQIVNNMVKQKTRKEKKDRKEVCFSWLILVHAFQSDKYSHACGLCSFRPSNQVSYLRVVRYPVFHQQVTLFSLTSNRHNNILSNNKVCTMHSLLSVFHVQLSSAQINAFFVFSGRMYAF